MCQCTMALTMSPSNIYGVEGPILNPTLVHELSLLKEEQKEKGRRRND